ncbi:hypothetical protein HAX54_043442, partial [Datura stramonium]|nr:hypothetical protein [Datura stramonium]
MNAIILEIPLEALAFDYLSFGLLFTVINSVWTWVVVITAAVSFWRIKTFSTLPTQEPRRGAFSVHVLSPSPPTPTVVTSPPSSKSSQVERVSSQLASNESCFAALGNNEEGTKGKFTVHYFKQDEGGEHNGDGEDCDQEGEDDVDVEFCEEWFENWERFLKMRSGEMGWYSYQDMKVIDGSVVRLWDGGGMRKPPLSR